MINKQPEPKTSTSDGMKSTIEELKTRNFQDVNKCDNEFIIDSKLVLHYEQDELHYTINQIPATKKRYGKDVIDYTTYIDNADKTIYLAYLAGQIAGQIILRRNWNHLAYIEDIAVDVKFRRQGIGKELISRAIDWAKKHGLMGIMLETQDNNVPACKFYESCGFQLRGFDTYLYKAIDGVKNELALYWYLFFGEVAPDQGITPDP